MKEKVLKKQALYGRVFILVVLGLSAAIFMYVKFFSSLWKNSKVKPISHRPVESSNDRFAILENAEPIVFNEEEFSILHISNEQMQRVSAIYVIPGGGSSPDHGYPEWTKRRVAAAHKHYESNHKDKETAIFLALSAGSLNSANTLLSDKRIRFECQFTIQHLLQLGIPRRIIFGDTFSWDTVTNGLTLRMLVEGVQEYRAQDEHNFEVLPLERPAPGTVMTTSTEGPAPTPRTVLKDLTLEVFISDFHADRVRESFQWILNLTPTVRSTKLHINVVNSMGIQWPNPLDYMHRIEHEEAGTKKIQENAKKIKTLAQFYAFLTLGGHQGLHKYVHYDYQTSKGGGW